MTQEVSERVESRRQGEWESMFLAESASSAGTGSPNGAPAQYPWVVTLISEIAENQVETWRADLSEPPPIGRMGQDDRTNTGRAKRTSTNDTLIGSIEEMDLRSLEQALDGSQRPCGEDRLC